MEGSQAMEGHLKIIQVTHFGMGKCRGDTSLNSMDQGKTYKKHGYVGLVFRKICLVCVNSLIVLLIQLDQLTAIPAAQELPVLYAVNELYLSIIGDV